MTQYFDELHHSVAVVLILISETITLDTRTKKDNSTDNDKIHKNIFLRKISILYIGEKKLIVCSNILFRVIYMSNQSQHIGHSGGTLL